MNIGVETGGRASDARGAAGEVPEDDPAAGRHEDHGEDGQLQGGEL